MEEAKNRIDGGDTESVRELLNNLIDKVHQDISLVNQSLSMSLNGTVANRSIANQSIANQSIANQTLANQSKISNASNNVTQLSNNRTETSVLGLLRDLFGEKEENPSPIETISKVNILSRSLKELSATMSSKDLRTFFLIQKMMI